MPDVESVRRGCGLYPEIHALIAEIRQDTCLFSNPRHTYEHPRMSDLLALPNVTKDLLELLSQAPDWIHMSALWKLHPKVGPTVGEEDRGRFDRLVELWLAWGQEHGHLPKTQMKLQTSNFP